MWLKIEFQLKIISLEALKPSLHCLLASNVVFEKFSDILILILYTMFLLFENFGYFLSVVLWSFLITSLSLCLFFILKTCVIHFRNWKNISPFPSPILPVTSTIQIKKLLGVVLNHVFPPIFHFFDFLRDSSGKINLIMSLRNDLQRKPKQSLVFWLTRYSFQLVAESLNKDSEVINGELINKCCFEHYSTDEWIFSIEHNIPQNEINTTNIQNKISVLESRGDNMETPR